MAARKTPIQVKVERAPRRKKADGNMESGQTRIVFPEATIDLVCDTMCKELLSERRTLEKYAIDRTVWWKMKREDKKIRERIQAAKEEMIADDMDIMVEKADMAFDRDTAAASMVQVRAREIRAKMIARNIYGTPLPEAQRIGGLHVGIVLLPPKQKSQYDAIEHNGGAMIDVQAIPEITQPKRKNPLLARLK